MTKVIMLGAFKFRGQELNVAQQLTLYLDNTPIDPENPQRGFTAAEIRRRARPANAIEDAAEAGQDHVELSETDYEVLKDVISKTTFAGADRALLKLIDSVENAPDGPYVRPVTVVNQVDLPPPVEVPAPVKVHPHAEEREMAHA